MTLQTSEKPCLQQPAMKTPSPSDDDPFPKGPGNQCGPVKGRPGPREAAADVRLTCLPRPFLGLEVAPCVICLGPARLRSEP